MNTAQVEAQVTNTNKTQPNVDENVGCGPDGCSKSMVCLANNTCHCANKSFVNASTGSDNAYKTSCICTNNTIRNTTDAAIESINTQTPLIRDLIKYLGMSNMKLAASLSNSNNFAVSGLCDSNKLSTPCSCNNHKSSCNSCGCNSCENNENLTEPYDNNTDNILNLLGINNSILNEGFTSLSGFNSTGRINPVHFGKY